MAPRSSSDILLYVSHGMSVFCEGSTGRAVVERKRAMNACLFMDRPVSWGVKLGVVTVNQRVEKRCPPLNSLPGRIWCLSSTGEWQLLQPATVVKYSPYASELLRSGAGTGPDSGWGAILMKKLTGKSMAVTPSEGDGDGGSERR